MYLADILLLVIRSKGAFLFTKQVMPYLLKHAESDEYPPTLVFTGATAAVKANAQMATFASSKFALRALAQSFAKEFAPQGVHVAHAIIDGPIDIPGDERRKGMAKEILISPDDIAEGYWHLHTQSKRCFTNEIDMRTSLEKW